METVKETAGAYTMAHQERIEASRQLAEENTRHEFAVAGLRRRIESAQARIDEGDAGLDADRIAIARTVVYVNGWDWRGDEGSSAVRDAISDIADGPKRLRSEYFGAKNYDRWTGQRCDCRYGYGPSHGSIVMSVGLTNDARSRDWSAAERDAALYYLNNIAKIELARKAQP